MEREMIIKEQNEEYEKSLAIDRAKVFLLKIFNYTVLLKFYSQKILSKTLF